MGVRIDANAASSAESPIWATADTVNDLRNLNFTPPYPNAFAVTLGTSILGDGNGALYYWNPTSTAADDGGVTAIKINTIATGRFLVVNIRLSSTNVLINTYPYFVYNLANIAALRANGSNSPMAVSLTGYYSPSISSTPDGGGGIFLKDLSDSTSADNNGTIIVDTLGHRWKRQTGPNIFNLLHFGAVNTGIAGTTYSDTALASAMAAAEAVGGAVYAPAGYYRFQNQYSDTPSFNSPTLYGDGGQSTSASPTYNTFGTIFDFTAGPSTTSFIVLNGGSGTSTKGFIRDIAFIGKADQTQNAIEINGLDGFRTIGCLFTSFNTGIWAHNSSAGNFTENCVAVQCSFLQSCLHAMRFTVGSGTGSFRASGLLDCDIAFLANAQMILIEAGATLYNAPVRVTAVGTGPATVIQNNNGSAANVASSTIVGHITLECNAGGNIANEGVIASGGLTYGSMSFSGNGAFTYGTFRNGDAIGFLGPESVNGGRFIRERPYSVQLPMTTGANQTVLCTNYGACLINLTLRSSSYEYSYLLFVRSAIGSMGLTVTAVVNTVITLGTYGAPTFGADASGHLTITNNLFPASGVTAYLDVQPMGLNPGAYGTAYPNYTSIGY